MKPIATHWTLALCPLVLLSGCMTAPEEKLRLAAAESNLLRVQTFLGQGISAQAADVRGVTPLFGAAKNGHPDVVALLHVAAYRGDQELITLLLQHGANKHARMTS